MITGQKSLGDSDQGSILVNISREKLPNARPWAIPEGGGGPVALFSSESIFSDPLRVGKCSSSQWLQFMRKIRVSAIIFS